MSSSAANLGSSSAGKTHADGIEFLTIEEGVYQEWQRKMVTRAQTKYSSIVIEALRSGNDPLVLSIPPPDDLSEPEKASWRLEDLKSRRHQLTNLSNTASEVTGFISEHLSAASRARCETIQGFKDAVEGNRFLTVWRMVRDAHVAPPATAFVRRAKLRSTLRAMELTSADDLEEFSQRYQETLQSLTDAGEQMPTETIIADYLMAVSKPGLAECTEFLFRNDAERGKLENLVDVRNYVLKWHRSKINQHSTGLKTYKSEVTKGAAVEQESAHAATSASASTATSANIATAKTCGWCRLKRGRDYPHSMDNCRLLQAFLREQAAPSTELKRRGAALAPEPRPTLKRRKTEQAMAATSVANSEEWESEESGNDTTRYLFDTAATNHFFAARGPSFSNILSYPISLTRVKVLGGEVMARSGRHHWIFGPVIETNTEVNLVSYDILRRTHVITLDTTENRITATNGRSTLIFQWDNEARGFFLLKVRQDRAMLSTETKFPKEQILRAQLARRLHDSLDHPSDQRLIELLNSGGVVNTSLTSADVILATRVLGQCLACAKGKSTAPPQRPSTSSLESAVGRILHMDLFYVNGDTHPYLITIDGFTGNIVVVRAETKKTQHVLNAINKAVSIYKGHRHDVRAVRTDREAVFSSVEESLNNAGIIVERSSPAQHEAKSERGIRTIKTAMRSTLANLPFRLPANLIKYLVFHTVQSINSLPNVHTTGTTPRVMVSGKRFDANISARASFGQFILAKIPNAANVLTDLQPRMETGIYIGRDQNSSGTALVWLLANKRVVHRHSFTILDPTPELIKLAEGSGNVEYEVEQTPVEETTLQSIAETTIESPVADGSSKMRDDADQGTKEKDLNADISHSLPSAASALANEPRVDQEEKEDGEDISEEKRQERGYMSLTKALQIDPEGAKQSIYAEIDNMINEEVWFPILRSDLSGEEKKKMIRCSVTTVEKFKDNKRIWKSRIVGDGSTQDPSTFREVSSATVQQSTIMIAFAAAAYQKLHFTQCDVKCAFLNADLDTDNINMIIPSNLARHLVERYPEYAEFVHHDGTIAVHIVKALYGIRQSSMLWFNTLSDALVRSGLIQSKHDSCLYIHPDQTMFCIVHVDDIGIFSPSWAHTSKLLLFLKSQFTDIVSSGEHDKQWRFLAIDIVQEEQAFTFSQKKHIDKLCAVDAETLPIVKTPAVHDLFPPWKQGEDDQREDSPLLNPEQGAIFRSQVMLAMFLSTRSRPDVAVTVAYLSTKCGSPNEADQKKLGRLRGYLWATRDIVLRIQPEDMVLIASIDASYLIHVFPELRSHAGQHFTVGGSTVHVSSRKIRAVCNSSTEAELVAVTDAVRKLTHLKGVLSDLRHPQRSTCIRQDNTSAMNIVEAATTSKTMRVKLDLIKEMISNNEIHLRHDRTLEITSDGFTKPLPLSRFLLWRDKILTTTGT